MGVVSGPGNFLGANYALCAILLESARQDNYGEIIQQVKAHIIDPGITMAFEFCDIFRFFPFLFVNPFPGEFF